MKSVRDLASIVLGLAILAAIGAGIYYAGVYVVELFRGLDPQIARIMYAAVIAAAGGALLVSMIVRWGGGRSDADRLRVEQAQAYRQLVEALAAALIEPSGADPQAALRAGANLREAERGLTLWGSGNAVKHYAALRRLDPRLDPRDATKSAAVEKLLRQMRSDLGHGNGAIDDGELAALLLSDGAPAAPVADVAPFEQRSVGEGPLR